MNKKRFIAQFCIFLIIMMPICFAQTFEQEGESLIIEVKKYEPETLRSDYMEQLNIPVRVILGAIRGAPISVPEIKGVKVELIKQKQAQKENASIKGTSESTIKTFIQGKPKFYKAPYPTLDNLGFVQITLKKIPQEQKVPKQIDLDFKATITYEADIAGFVISGENTKFLKQGTVEMVKDDREKHSILGGRYYLRVASIKGRKATIEVLDHNFERKTRLTLDEGDLSRSIRLDKEIEPYSIRLKLEELRGAGDVILQFKDDQDGIKERILGKGQEIGGGWEMYNYFERRDRTGYDRVVLKNSDFKSRVVLTSEQDYNSIDGLKERFEECSISAECKIYKGSSIEVLKNYKYSKEDFKDALASLENIGLVEFKSIKPQEGSRVAILEVGALVDHYVKGEKIGHPDCDCKVSSISTEHVWVKGIIEDCGGRHPRSGTKKLSLNDGQEICGDNIELEGITSEQEAVITVLPGTGKGKTTTYFSIHIPVEERALQYTQEELQSKINRTKATIAELDITINKLQKLVEGWTKICLATAAIFTVASFFQGISGQKLEKPAEDSAKKIEDGADKESKEKRLYFPNDPTLTKLKVYDLPEGEKLSGIFVKKYVEINSRNIDQFYINKEGEIYYRSLNKHEYIGELYYRFEGDNKKIYTVGHDGIFKEVDKNYGSHQGSSIREIGISSDLNEITVPIKNCDQFTSTHYQQKCKIYQKTHGTGLYMVYNKQEDYIRVFWGGVDGKIYKFKSGKQDGDKGLFGIEGSSQEGERIKKRMIKIRDSYQRKERTFKWGTREYDLNRNYATPSKEGVECHQVMSPGQCKILFNACDPVMCPSSRCDFGGRYRVDNVIQSGFIGSILLCLPNIKDGIIMPVCLSGILASLKNLRSILQGYVECLEEALHNDKSVGICDRIRSIYICQILWRETMFMLGLTKGNLFDAVAGSGGGEYLTGLKGGVAKAGRTVDFFTNEYAKSVFAAYRGRSSRELGAIICEKAIYGKLPVLGEILEDVTKAQNPPQFTAYIEEQPLYSETEQESMYKLYYHIYAGSETVNYKVFIRKPGKRDYTCSECSGVIEPESFVDKSTLFMQEPEYQEICVIINGKQYCNFGKVVSSSFGVNKANDYLLNYEISKKITTEEQCRSGLRGIIPHAQVEKVCSQLNPGIGKGNNIEQQWKKIGTCGKNEDKIPLGDCWIKLGAIEETNPTLYMEISGNICENDGGIVCGADEVCDGRKDITTVRSYQNVVCCYGECKKDTVYEKTKNNTIFTASLDYPVYRDMHDQGIKTCKELRTTDPFQNPPLEWIDKEEKMKDAQEGSEEYNKFHYFKGVMYLLCNNCEKAPYEFNLLDKDSDYFKTACGENTKEDGGLMFNQCETTCDGRVEKEDEKEEKERLAFKQIELYTTLNLNEPAVPGMSPNDIWAEIDVPEYEEDLERGGLYRVKLKFSGDTYLKECKITVGSDEETVKLPDTITTECFSEKVFKFLEDKITLKFDIKDKNDNELSKTIIFTNKEQSVQPGKSILCQTYEDNYFCIGNPGERCSDYSTKDENKRAQFEKEWSKSLEGCKNECPSQDPCTSEHHGYAKG